MINIIKKENKKGFTLIELLVVIAVISLLSSVVLSSLNSARAKARDARRKEDAHQLEIALHFYYDDNGTYPNTVYTEPNYFTEGPPGLVSLLAPYMSNVPNDPLWTPLPRSYFYYTGKLDATWINANGSWAFVTMDCVDKYILVVRLMEKSNSNRQDCTMTRSDVLSIVIGI